MAEDKCIHDAKTMEKRCKNDGRTNVVTIVFTFCSYYKDIVTFNKSKLLHLTSFIKGQKPRS